MATTNTPAAKTTTPKEKKPPVPPALRLADQLKRAALTKKITPEELDHLAELAASLKVFLK